MAVETQRRGTGMGEFAIRRALPVIGVARLGPAADSSEVWASRVQVACRGPLSRHGGFVPCEIAYPARSLTHAHPPALGPHRHRSVPTRGDKSKNGSPEWKDCEPRRSRQPRSLRLFFLATLWAGIPHRAVTHEDGRAMRVMPADGIRTWMSKRAGYIARKATKPPQRDSGTRHAA